MVKKQKKHNNRLLCLALAVLVLVIGFLGFLTVKISTASTAGNAKEKTSATNVSSQSEPEFIETSATVMSIGDIMVHSPQLNGALNSSTGDYNFDCYFKEIAPYFATSDLNVGNLEVTFGGNESREFSGYPLFNTPDSLADSIKNAGFNLLLTSNNHCYDTGLAGLKRTAQVLKQKGIEFTGTKETDADPAYVIKQVNNINIGIINYTYETKCLTEGRKYLNGNPVNSEANGLINSFNYDKLDAFYSEIGAYLKEMDTKGAEFKVVYIHWGNEYQTYSNTYQKSIAQKLCNMGVDMIIGSHPHVIQPIELVTSEDSQNTTVCLYSMGNAVSNQRQELMTSCPSGHTEDGMIFEFVLKKTKAGVTLESLDLTPTWVNKYLVSGKYNYTIYPIENPNDLGKYSFNATALSKAQKSYERTKAIVAEGLTACQQSIGCPVTFQ
ncbi:MAG: CapA family protein [Acutalibacteraceae bacterium]|nr:CapA family protein [Acutalibacteraceae bacterium]